MKNDWGGTFHFTIRKYFRPLIYDLYAKVGYCAPNRPITHYKRKRTEDYKDPVKIRDREDLSKCPGSEEMFTETEYSINHMRVPNDNDESYKPMKTNNQLTIKEDDFIEILEGIDDQIDELQEQSADKDDHTKQRMAIIEQLENVEKEIMKTDWGDKYYVIVRINFRPLIYRLYEQLKYCAPNCPRTYYERKPNEAYEDPINIPDRNNLSNCPNELYTKTYYDNRQNTKSYIYKSIRVIQSSINKLEKMTKNIFNSKYKQLGKVINSDIKFIREKIQSKNSWQKELIPIINGITTRLVYAVEKNSILDDTVTSSKNDFENKLHKINYDINELQKNSYQNGYSDKSIVKIIKELNDVQNQINKKKMGQRVQCDFVYIK